MKEKSSTTVSCDLDTALQISSNDVERCSCEFVLVFNVEGKDIILNPIMHNERLLDAIKCMYLCQLGQEAKS